MISRYVAVWQSLGLYLTPTSSGFSFNINPCVDPDCYLAPVITTALQVDRPPMRTLWVYTLAGGYAQYAAQLLSPKVRGFTFVSTANLYRRIRLGHSHWYSPPEVRLGPFAYAVVGN